MSYNRETIERLVPGIWDEAFVMNGRDPLAPEPGAPKTKADPSHGNGKLAMLCDVQQAWKYADLTHDERRSILVRFGMDETYADAAQILDTYEMAVHRHCTRGIQKMGLFLNGGKPWPEELTPAAA